jgi:hypothetical protein
VLAAGQKKVRGLKNSEVTFSAAAALSAAPLMYSLRCDYLDFVVLPSASVVSSCQRTAGDDSENTRDEAGGAV